MHQNEGENKVLSCLCMGEMSVGVERRKWFPEHCSWTGIMGSI
jgi:hypothetical protein